MVLAQADWVKMKFRMLPSGVRMPQEGKIKNFDASTKRKNNNHRFLCTRRPDQFDEQEADLVL